MRTRLSTMPRLKRKGSSDAPMTTTRPSGRMPCAASSVDAHEFDVPRSTSAPPAFCKAAQNLVGAQVANHLFFIFRPGHGNGSETRSLSVLQCQVAEAANANDGHALVRLGIGKSKSAPDGVSRAENRC